MDSSLDGLPGGFDDEKDGDDDSGLGKIRGFIENVLKPPDR